MIFGRYERDIENGAISIPWLEKGEFNLPCFYEIINYNEKSFFYVCDLQAEVRENVNVIEIGQCELNEDGKWILPQAILDVLGGEECLWLGIGEKCTLTSKKRLQEDEPDYDKIKEALLKLGF